MANVASDFAVEDLEVVNLGEVATGTLTSATTGAFTGATVEGTTGATIDATSGVVTGLLVMPATVTVCQVVQFAALSLTRISTAVIADFRTPLADTDKDKSTKGIEILLA